MVRRQLILYSTSLALLGGSFLSLQVLAFKALCANPRAISSQRPRRGARALSNQLRRAAVTEVGAGASHDESRTDEPCSRRDILRSMLLGSATLCSGALAERANAAAPPNEAPTVGKITKSGIKYFEYRTGDGISPRWGQDCVVRFVMFGRTSPDAKLVKIQSSDDNQDVYLFKHGNGRQIKGMEEGLHTMRVGGKRRIIIPQQLGYVVQGLGPYPALPRRRDTLVKMLESFEGTTEGELVMDVELLDAFDDEADQGYYEDEAVTPEQLEELVADKRKVSARSSFERTPGESATPMDDGATTGSQSIPLPGQLGRDIQGG